MAGVLGRPPTDQCSPNYIGFGMQMLHLVSEGANGLSAAEVEGSSIDRTCWAGGTGTGPEASGYASKTFCRGPGYKLICSSQD